MICNHAICSQSAGWRRSSRGLCRSRLGCGGRSRGLWAAPGCKALQLRMCWASCRYALLPCNILPLPLPRPMLPPLQFAPVSSLPLLFHTGMHPSVCTHVQFLSRLCRVCPACLVLSCAPVCAVFQSTQFCPCSVLAVQVWSCGMFVC